MSLQNPLPTVERVQIAPLGGLEVVGSASLWGDVENQGLITTDNGILRFDGMVTGDGNSTRHVIFTGGYSPDISPAMVMHEEVTFTQHNQLTLEIGGTEAREYDQIQISGLVHLGGHLQIESIEGFQLQVGDALNLFQWNEPLGTFRSIETLSPLVWDLSCLYSEGTVLVASIPEPAGWVLLIVGLTSSALFRVKYAGQG